jgi:hypothetical protein
MSIAGKWCSSEMDHWDQDAIDLVGPAFIEFGGQAGRFRSGFRVHPLEGDDKPSAKPSSRAKRGL